MSGGQQNKDEEIVKMVARMNELKEKQDLAGDVIVSDLLDQLDLGLVNSGQHNDVFWAGIRWYGCSKHGDFLSKSRMLTSWDVWTGQD